MKTSELNEAVLDLAVAKCEGVPLIAGCLFTKDPKDGAHYSPSTDWALGGAIIEREEISIVRVSSALWDAHMSNVNFFESGATPLIAAMRCYVASKLGDEVELPEDLTNE
jgi:hypothetical protein